MDSLKTKFITPEELPLVIEPENKALSFEESMALLRAKNAFLREELLKHGALLLRNFPIQTAGEFVTVINNLGLGDFTHYIGGDSPRKKVTGGVYTSTETPPSMTLPLHNELSYVKKYPEHIYFFCLIAPQERGETTIADARKIYHAIDPDVRARFTEKKLRYISRYPYKSAFMNRGHKSWVNVFETEDKKEVERKCYENEFLFTWNKNDWLEIRHTRPSVLAHPQTQEMVWFNQAHHFDFNPKFLSWWRYIGAKIFYFRKYTLLHEVAFEDGTKIPRKDLYHILDVLEKHSVYFPWKKGDVLILDNILAMHGRASFSGKRRILTAMTGNHS